jgi:hypothetical protein
LCDWLANSILANNIFPGFVKERKTTAHSAQYKSPNAIFATAEEK